MHPNVETSLAHVRALVRRGAGIRDALAADASNPRAQADARIWQRDCAAAITQLSGGSKAHWVSRAYSAALLVRSESGGAILEARVADIVDRVIEVLDRAAQSLRQPDAVLASPLASPPAATSGADAPAPRRFDFVHDQSLRPIVEAAFVESGRALDDGDYTRSLLTTCSVLEAVITDALCSAKASAERGDDLRALSFADRIAAAEQLGLIRGGCARLPDAARNYRVPGAAAVVTQRDARVARQVLHVVLRDLDPGR
jgi:hypothetical protein